MATFGETVKRLRKEKKITQRELGKLVGVDFTYISKMENDALNILPSEKIIDSIAEQIGANPDELMLLAKKVPTSIKNVIVGDELATMFLRKVPKLTPDQRARIKKVIDEEK